MSRNLSAGVVIVRWLDREPKYLLLRAYRYWDFPKGKVEAGELPLAAARREVSEEAGLEQLEFHWGDAHVETPPYGRGKVARYYLAEAPAGEVVLGVNPALGRPEHHEFRWVSYAQASRLVNDRVRVVLDWAQRHVAGGRPND